MLFYELRSDEERKQLEQANVVVDRLVLVMATAWLRTVVDVVVRASGVNKFDQIDGKARKSAKSVDVLGKSINRLGRALAGLAVGDQLRRAFGAAAELSGTEQRIDNVTKKYQQFIGINKSAAEASKAFAISQQQALSDFSDLASRLGSLVHRLRI